MTNERKTTYNALNIRGLIKLPSQIICNHTGVATFGDISPAPLLHQAYAFCGRVLSCLCLTLITLNI